MRELQDFLDGLPLWVQIILVQEGFNLAADILAAMDKAAAKTDNKADDFAVSVLKRFYNAFKKRKLDKMQKQNKSNP